MARHGYHHVPKIDRGPITCRADMYPASPTINCLQLLFQICFNEKLRDVFLLIPSIFSLSILGTVLILPTMSSEVTFGPPGQEWHYSKTARTYDISGGSAKNIFIHTTEGPKETSVTIDPESSALVIVDMQNFFLDPQCMEHPNGLKAVEPTIKVIEKCREVGIQVNFHFQHFLWQSEADSILCTDNLAQLGPH